MSTATKTEKKPKKPTGKERGLSLRRCLATDKVYSRDMEGPLPYLYFIPLSLAWLSATSSCGTTTGAWAWWG